MTRRAWAEPLAVVATAALHPIAKHAWGAQGPYIVAAVLGWSFYVALRVRTDGRALRAWGLSSDGLRPTVRLAALLAVCGAGLLAGIAYGRGSLRFHTDMIPLALLYPVWGVVQQLLVLGMVVANLMSSCRTLSRSLIVVPLAGLLFGAVHLPDPRLTVATAAMGALFAAVFVRHRNVWPLGVVHGELGVLFYFWVLERNPWPELLASIGLAARG